MGEFVAMILPIRDSKIQPIADYRHAGSNKTKKDLDAY